MNVAANYIITLLKIFIFKKPWTLDIDSEARLKKSYNEKNNENFLFKSMIFLIIWYKSWFKSMI